MHFFFFCDLHSNVFSFLFSKHGMCDFQTILFIILRLHDQVSGSVEEYLPYMHEALGSILRTGGGGGEGQEDK